MIVCLCGDVETERLLEVVAAEAPRVAASETVVYADARGLDAERLAEHLLARAQAECVGARAGIARAAIVAEVAAFNAAPGSLLRVPEDERAFLAAQPLSVLSIDARALELLRGVGVESCGNLAALDREAVEVRFGPELLRVWEHARAEDRRRLFMPVPPDAPVASIDYVDYVVSDPERLIFSVNALLNGLCDDLQTHGLHARRVRLTLTLANGTTWQRMLKPARATASRTVWLRLTRVLLERITIDDAVTGVALVIDGTESAGAVQGDLFDAGFATSSAVDAALSRLIEDQAEVIVEPDVSAHPLVEQRSRWRESGLEELAPTADDVRTPVGLTLQLLSDPREVLVETIRRRDHVVPIRYRDGQWKQLLTTAGPHRISGGQWESAYAREYFRGVTVDGILVWLYRDAREGKWFLHGWWD